MAHAWLVDPKTHTLEAYALREGSWRPIGLFRHDDPVAIAPFEQVRILLADLWV